MSNIFGNDRFGVIKSSWSQIRCKNQIRFHFKLETHFKPVLRLITSMLREKFRHINRVIIVPWTEIPRIEICQTHSNRLSREFDKTSIQIAEIRSICDSLTTRIDQFCPNFLHIGCNTLLWKEKSFKLVQISQLLAIHTTILVSMTYMMSKILQRVNLSPFRSTYKAFRSAFDIFGTGVKDFA